MYELEDLYAPYKPKRKTRASIAKEKGLEPLAMRLYTQENGNVEEWAKPFINEEKGVNNIDEALDGAIDILAEFITEHEITRTKLRKLFIQKSMIVSKVISGKEGEGNKYEIYFDNKELIRKISHRLLAMLRGENEGFLRVKVEPDEEEALDLLYNIIKMPIMKRRMCGRCHDDGYKRLLKPQLEPNAAREPNYVPMRSITRF